MVIMSLAVVNVILLGFGSAAADSGDPDLGKYFANCDPRYDDDVGMLATTWHSPGYHTTVANGARAHPTRDSLTYALALLQSGESERAERAGRIVGKVLTLQDTNPDSKTYGIWPWLLEEPLSKMSPPDWNWAAFCGALIAQMLIEAKDRLEPGVAEAMRESLNHAARSIVRRNVGPGYTNIAVMSAGVTVAAGELLAESELLEYGVGQLQKIVEHREFHGGFNEYNSPTYTMVALHECERMLELVKHEAARADAERLRRYLWQTIADHFHPATGQWAGPHSRDYGLWVRADRARYLAEQTGAAVRVHPKAGSSTSSWPNLMKPLPCPPDLAGRFHRLPEPEVEVVRRAIRRDTDEASTWITTWFTPDACLGSVNRGLFWTQRHVVLAYWNGPDAVPVALRLRFLHDDVDFSSAYSHNAQQANRILSAVGVVTNRGDFHPSLDRPKDGTFEAEDFRLRCELVGTGAAARALEDGRYELAAGAYRVVIHTSPGRFDTYPVRWETSNDDERACVDAVCYHGEKRAFTLADLREVRVLAGIELIGADAAPTDQPVVAATQGENIIQSTWAGLTLRTPLGAQRYP